MEVILDAAGLNTFYGSSHILFDVSLQVGAGETVCLTGRNGAGKTTTFRTLMGLAPPKTGVVSLKGRNCTRLPPFKRARLGMGLVPEDRRIFGPFTIKENLELGIISGRKGKWDFESVYEYFPVLRRFSDRMGGTLSGGEQQMLAIARALMGNPEVLILDEPSEGLSPVMVQSLRDLILSLKQDGATILLSEQNSKFAMAVSDRVLVIDKGHVVYQAGIEEFRENKAIQKKYLAV